MKPHHAILLDIEGTTTSISFVYDQLFPFARAHAEGFLADHWNDNNVRADVAMIQEELGTEQGSDVPRLTEDMSPAQVAQAVFWFMDSDRKTTGLKSLQGKIWTDGYQTGELKGHIFEDVEPALKRWAKQNIPVYIYSSGSIAAQQLLFSHTIAGDLTPWLAGYFDTTTGPKQEASSYTKIADAIGLAAKDVLFATDKLAEARAAKEAQMPAIIMLRPGNTPITKEHAFAIAENFDHIT